jgi:hypothetical protein
MATEKANVYGKLLSVQKELKAPKGQYNSFGKYNYRSCEDILEGVKPLLDKHKATLFISDNLEMIGSRFYVKAVARFVDTESGECVESSAYAREEEVKKGMDSSQVTGATSSYARKYALNGLFLIDDTKDADTDAYQEQQIKATDKKITKISKKEEFSGMNPPEEKSDAQKDEEMKASVDKDLIPESGKTITPEQLAKIQAELDRTGVSLKQVLSIAKVDKLEDIKQTTFSALMTKFSHTSDKKG